MNQKLFNILIFASTSSDSKDSSRFGVSQSKLAQRVSPPQKSEWGGGVISFVIGLLCLGFSSSFVKIVGLLLVVYGVYRVYTSIRFNFKDFAGLYMYWKKSWYCNKCGNIYHEVESYLEHYKGD